MGTDIFDVIHLSAGRVQRLVALELVTRGVRAAALAAGEGPAGAQRGAPALLLLLARLALSASPGHGPDCGHNLLLMDLSTSQIQYFQ